MVMKIQESLICNTVFKKSKNSDHQHFEISHLFSVEKYKNNMRRSEFRIIRVTEGKVNVT